MFTPLQILNQYWGFSSFREPQEEIINSVLSGGDTIALLPTGGGKSVCFQVPALANDGVCIVISPLIALMQDQVTNLTDKGIKATTIPSGSSQDEIITLFDNIRYGYYKFLYLSPERLQSKFIQEKIAQLTVSLIAVDEAHCISEWGHDFRPSYLHISVLRKIHPSVPIIALTASATQKVINDISTLLELKDPSTYKKSFFRKNLAYQIIFTDDKLYKLKQIFTKTKGSAIVYVNTRNKTQKISAFLNANGFKSGFYHGGLSSVEKKMIFNDWMSEHTPIMVATNAFGMGIDKPNVRIVVHLNLPASIENYVQEAGRGGRDGKKAFSVVLTNNSDIRKTIDIQQKSLPTIIDIKDIHKRLYQHFQVAKGELIESSFDFNFLEFCSKYQFVPNKTFVGLQILQSNGIIQLNDNAQQKSTIQFLVSSNQILAYASNNHHKKNFINSLLRMYGGLFEQAVKIDEFYLAKKAEITSWKTIEYLEKMSLEGLIEYKKANDHSELFFLHPREDDKTINRISKNIDRYLQLKQRKTDELIAFIENNTVCRSIQLLEYFGEKHANKCGICDVCIQNKNTIQNITGEIISVLKTGKELSAKEINEQLPHKETDILINLCYLLSEEKIGLTNYNKYFLR
ncbi:ATP-dependent DNA helicase RecQ [Tenacibaculum sp. IB213877]|uniref:RecQ family ATP-dependent DNA helicase n=1 Tax=Tenacibaculum sp. IB213877 TaxID=3097351 RepID=UPI002A5A8795|nr:ATP-dependent DNA helicase RecQ [Tenacibaculum sp. IB213877]MDY0779251.1 ATP-dependent DNA helicase RecQ [Tenacibaculum sp. IB213877]